MHGAGTATISAAVTSTLHQTRDKATAHTNTDCKSCHYDATGKLDSHVVPTGKSGGVNCTSYHNIGGSAGHDVDITNMGNSAHANMNNKSQYTGGNIKTGNAGHATVH